MKQEIKMVKPEELIPYENNPRDNDNAVEAVANSIKEFGFKQPIVVDKNMVIIVGHTRLKASQKLGLEEVPVLVAEDLTPEQVRAYRLADNKTGELADWDYEKLYQEVSTLELDGVDMAEFGMEDIGERFGLDFNNAEEDEYETPQEEIEPKTKQGQVWQLGEHRLMVGDSTNKADVQKLTNGELMDLVVTDPPYNVAYEGGTEEAMTIENDNMSDAEFQAFLDKAIGNMQDVLKLGGVFYIWHADTVRTPFTSALEKNGLKERSTLIWVKNQLTFGRADYKWRHEPCLYGWKEGSAHYFIEDFTQTTVIEDYPKLKALTKDQLISYVKELRDVLDAGTTIMREDKPLRNGEHPTMKPVKLIARQIANSSRKGENVLDLFGGSGTTLIASEQLNRRCFMMEYDERYADVIIDRWEKLTNDKAVLLND